MPRTKRRERHKLNKTKKIYYGGNNGPEEKKSEKIIMDSHNETIEENVKQIDEIKINEIDKIINLKRKRNLKQFWLTEIIQSRYYKDDYHAKTNPNRVEKYLLNEGEKDISYKNINRLLEKKGIGLQMLFDQVGHDVNRQHGDYIKVNNSAIIDVIKNLSKNEDDVEKKYKDYINNYYKNDVIPVIPALEVDKLRGFKLMMYYREIINEHPALVENIIQNKNLSMDNILLQIIFLTSNQSIAQNRSDTLSAILKTNSVMNFYSELKPISDGEYTTSAESIYNIVEFTITDDDLKETLYINDIATLRLLDPLYGDIASLYVGYMTGTIKIDYIKQTFIEDISIHIDPRITYANKLLPSPVSEPASAPASAPVDPVAPEPAPEPEPEEEPIDNEDIIDIFYSTNLNKNQNYYIFNMLETMS